MDTITDPFYDSTSLADWSHDTLLKAGLADIVSWRMLEYWFQVELYRGIDQLTNWSHFGTYEQPYYTKLPRSGSKTNVKEFGSK
jgi:hypothetical protein